MLNQLSLQIKSSDSDNNNDKNSFKLWNSPLDIKNMNHYSKDKDETKFMAVFIFYKMHVPIVNNSH